jgi:hypothetical protein
VKGYDNGSSGLSRQSKASRSALHKIAVYKYFVVVVWMRVPMGSAFLGTLRKAMTGSFNEDEKDKQNPLS